MPSTIFSENSLNSILASKLNNTLLLGGKSGSLGASSSKMGHKCYKGHNIILVGIGGQFGNYGEIGPLDVAAYLTSINYDRLNLAG